MDHGTDLNELLYTVQVAENIENLSGTLGKAANLLGFDFFAYGFKSPYPLTSPKIDMINNYPSGWCETYCQNEYLNVDPTVQHGLQSTLPVYWSDNLFSSIRPLWEDAQSFGLNHGWAQSCRDANGNIGMLTLARSDEEISCSELVAKSAQFNWLVQLAHVSYSEQMKTTQKNTSKLTAREIDILRWTAEGKSSGDIAIILNISGRTVNFHVNNVLSKLNSANKTSAVVQAALTGLIR